MDNNEMNHYESESSNEWQPMPYQEVTNYDENTTIYQEPESDSKDGLCIAALVLGIVGFFLNPVYLVSILAIIFGIVGITGNGPKCNYAKVGLGLGIGSLVIQFILDFIVTFCTAGFGIFSFCC